MSRDSLTKSPYLTRRTVKEGSKDSSCSFNGKWTVEYCKFRQALIDIMGKGRIVLRNGCHNRPSMLRRSPILLEIDILETNFGLYNFSPDSTLHK